MSVLFVLAWIVAIGLVCIGLYSLLAPRLLAGHYGVEVEHHTGEGYVRATGVRDIALGVILGAIAYTHSRTLLIIFAIVAIVVSLVDLLSCATTAAIAACISRMRFTPAVSSHPSSY